MNNPLLLTATLVFVIEIAINSARSEDKQGIELSYHEPDHLVPVNPYPSKESEEYYARVKSRLRLGGRSIAKMTVMPSFSPEYGLRLDGVKRKKNSATTEKFLLTYSVADNSIWLVMPWNSINQKKQQKVSVTSTSVELPKPLVKQIHSLWKRMLLRTRYPDDGGGCEDGTLYEFGMGYAVYGETKSPYIIGQRKSPMLFVELGESLINYCKAPPENRADATKKIENRVKLLQNYLDEHKSK